MKSLWIMILAYFLVMQFSHLAGICGGVFGLGFSFILAFFQNVIGWKKVLAFLCGSTFVEFGNVLPAARASLSSLSVFDKVPGNSSTFLSLFVPSLAFVQLFAYSLILYCISLYLIRRWKLHDRCGNTCFR